MRPTKPVIVLDPAKILGATADLAGSIAAGVKPVGTKPTAMRPIPPTR